MNTGFKTIARFLLPHPVRRAAPLLLTLTMSLLLTACPAPPRHDATEASLTAWTRFLASGHLEANPVPFNATLSIRYKTPEQGERFGAYFWSNLDQARQPVRLDVIGAMNATAAMAYEDSRQFLLYDVENNLVYQGNGSTQSLLRLGLPLPLRLNDLVLLINGHYAAFFLGEESTSVSPLPVSDLSNQEEYAFALPALRHETGSDNLGGQGNGLGGQGGTLVLDAAGRPLRWQENGSSGWLFEFSYPGGNQAGQNFPGPMRLQASHPKGYSVSVLVKNFSRPDQPFTPEQLRLNLPDTVQIKQL